MAEYVEALVIGAGVIGSSVAMNLARLGMPNVRCVDLDLEGNFSSSELNAGGVRATFAQSVNIDASKISIDYFATVAEQIGYRACGYLWLQPESRMPWALQARERQLKHGWPVDLWDVAELQKRVPFIDKTAGIAGAFFSPRDGLVNPNLVKVHFREEAKRASAQFDDRVWIESTEAALDGYVVRGWKLPAGLDPEGRKAILLGKPVEGAERIEYRAERVINCAGAWAPRVADLLHYACPSHPVRRQACMFDGRDIDLTPYGMIVDTSGVYFHPEATYGLCGIANREEPHGMNFDYQGPSFFEELIWPHLYERSTKFEQLKHVTGWAGQYEVSPDESAILGRVELGEAGRSGRVFEAHSFSGHGVMHSYAAGLALAERIVHGRYECFDANPLSGMRFERGESVKESAVI